MRRFGKLAGIISLMVGWTACTPTCEQTCNKLLSCEEEGLESPLMNLDECTSSCASQSNWYEDNEKVEQQDAFDKMKTCISNETCEDLQEGICYDSEVYIW